jgi:hypothetical protein
MPALGRPLPPALSIPTPTDEEIRKAIQLWNANCPPGFAGLLEAEPVDKIGAKSRFLYDRETMKYYLRVSGREIPRRQINQAFIFFNNRTAEK